MASPRVSVIVACFNAIDTIERCLSALASQDTDEPFEVVVIDSSRDGTADLIRQRFPNVSLHTFADRKFPGEARNLGVARSEGEILAFTDADCVPDRSWVRVIVESHRRPDPVIGGTIDNLRGFFRSDDQGATWVRINDDAHHYGNVTVINGDARIHGRLFVGTNGRGILYADKAAK